ncbi:MAG TPA: ABC transporter C-terminal domain-containing protein, partial [Bryobacteraceae bacterium]
LVLGLDGRGGAQVFADYWQWEQAESERESVKPEKPAVLALKPAALSKKKLFYLEFREWEQMEERILEAEREVENLHAEMQSPEVVSDGARLQECYIKLQRAEARVTSLYARWAELESKIG